MSMFEHLDEVYEIEPRQRLMLQALILEAPRDEESFSRWLAEVDFDALDFFPLRLVPALFRKFGDAKGDNPYRERMKGIYRYYLFRNSLFLAESRRAIERMLDAGIDVLLFKGIAIALKYHRSIAVRPMADIDVLVRPESVPQAEDILLQCGWKYPYPEEKKSMDVHSHDYVKPTRGGFDLHWYSLLESPHAGIDDGIWERAEFFDWDGLIVKFMSPEDLLLTSAVNGVRETDPMSSQWIHDVACIVAAEPVILWTTLWEEARRRGLRDKVFNALDLVRRFSSEIISDALLDTFLDSDPEFYRDFLKSAIADGRAHGLIHANKDEVEAILSSGEGTTLGPGTGGAYAAAANAPGALRHIRYFRNENDAIDRLFLQRRHLPLLAELFEVGDQPALEKLVADLPKTGEGYVDIPPGLLATKPKPTLPVYSARIAVANGPSKLVLAPGEMSEISVEVENDSPCCWPVCARSSALFGVSYHLLSEDGAMLIWDLPRTYLSIARKGYVAFIEPSQKLTCKLKIIAPREAGRYVAQLDLVHEYVLWFSGQGIQFPRIELEVRRLKPIDRYVINGHGIVHETIGHETVIINTASGTYYSANGYGSLIWNAIADGYGEIQIISAFASAGIFAAEQRIVEQFFSLLLTEKLIAASAAGGTDPRGEPRLEKLLESQVPVLTKHAELHELIAMHPIRGASAQAGWPYRDGTSA